MKRIDNQIIIDEVWQKLCRQAWNNARYIVIVGLNGSRANDPGAIRLFSLMTALNRLNREMLCIYK